MPRHFPEYEIEFTDKPSSQDLEILDNGINNHLESIFGKVQRGGLLFLAKVDGRTVGGASGYWNDFSWLYVNQLWVSESERGKGLGKHLMHRIETEAVRRGCTNVYLNTMSFQAPEFYKRLGYSVFAELEDFPAGHSKLFLRKRL